MLPNLSAPLTDEAAAIAFLSGLADEGALFHPDDSAHNIVTTTGQRMFTPAAADLIDARIAECFALLPDIYTTCAALCGCD